MCDLKLCCELELPGVGLLEMRVSRVQICGCFGAPLSMGSRCEFFL